MLRQAAALIDDDRDDGAYAYMMREVADHIDEVKSGKHTLAEFADAYCMDASAAKTGATS
jgi:hypothetical protein